MDKEFYFIDTVGVDLNGVEASITLVGTLRSRRTCLYVIRVKRLVCAWFALGVGVVVLEGASWARRAERS